MYRRRIHHDDCVTCMCMCVCMCASVRVWTALLSVVGGDFERVESERDQRSPGRCFRRGGVCANSDFFQSAPVLIKLFLYIMYIILLRWSPRRPTVNDGDKKKIMKKKNDRKTKSLCRARKMWPWRDVARIAVYYIISYCIRLIVN